MRIILIHLFAFLCIINMVNCEQGRSGGVSADNTYSIFRMSKQFLQDRTDEKTGELVMRIIGEEQDLNASFDLVTLYDFTAFFWNRSDEGEVNITQLTAKIGELQIKKNSFIARGNVVIIREAQTRMETEVAEYDDDKKTISTPPDVLVDIWYAEDGSHCQGYGLKTFRPIKKQDKKDKDKEQERYDKLELENPVCNVMEEDSWRQSDF